MMKIQALHHQSFLAQVQIVQMDHLDCLTGEIRIMTQLHQPLPPMGGSVPHPLAENQKPKLKTRRAVKATIRDFPIQLPVTDRLIEMIGRRVASRNRTPVPARVPMKTLIVK